MKHEIDEKNLREWQLESEFEFASSTRERKRLTATLDGYLKICVAGVTKWKGRSAAEAAAIYNGITRKYEAPNK